MEADWAMFWQALRQVSNAVIGIAIIIGSGLYVIWRERQVGKTATIPPTSTPI